MQREYALAPNRRLRREGKVKYAATGRELEHYNNAAHINARIESATVTQEFKVVIRNTGFGGM